MNKIEEFERDLKVAYLNYENNDLKETLKYLDRMLETILKEDKSLENDPFWKTLTCDVFKAIVLNNFYNKVELTVNDLDSLLVNKEEIKRNIQEFCNNFKDNDLINSIFHIENITDKPLESIIKIIMVNIGKMNIADIKVEINTNDKTNNMIQKIDCFCGKTFELDWNKIPSTERFIYVRCPYCGSEIKLKNMYYKDKGENLKNKFLKIVQKYNSDVKTFICSIKDNKENIITKMNVSYFENDKEIKEQRKIFSFKVIDIQNDFILIKSHQPMSVIKDNTINLNSSETVFKISNDDKLNISTLTTGYSYQYELSIISEFDEELKNMYVFGTFINVDNINEFQKYLAEKGMSSKAKEDAFNWIKQQKEISILKIDYTASWAGYHDEGGGSKTTTETNIDNAKFIPLVQIDFNCVKNNEEFTLTPHSLPIKINNKEYWIPVIYGKINIINELDLHIFRD